MFDQVHYFAAIGVTDTKVLIVSMPQADSPSIVRDIELSSIPSLTTPVCSTIGSIHTASGWMLACGLRSGELVTFELHFNQTMDKVKPLRTQITQLGNSNVDVQAAAEKRLLASCDQVSLEALL